MQSAHCEHTYMCCSHVPLCKDCMPCAHCPVHTESSLLHSPGSLQHSQHTSVASYKTRGYMVQCLMCYEMQQCQEQCPRCLHFVWRKGRIKKMSRPKKANFSGCRTQIIKVLKFFCQIIVVRNLV